MPLDADDDDLLLQRCQLHVCAAPLRIAVDRGVAGRGAVGRRHHG
jgi:hypothetical protein